MTLQQESMAKNGDSDAETAPTPAVDISRDELFSLLSNRRRRLVLHHLKSQEDGQADFRTLVDVIAAEEFDVSVEQLSWKQRKRVYTALRQTHLPRLAGAGVISYDKSRGTVELAEEAGEVRMYLEYVPEDDIPWSQYYLGLTVIGAAILGMTWGGIVPFSQLSGTALAAIFVGMFGISALVHEVHLRDRELGGASEGDELLGETG